MLTFNPRTVIGFFKMSLLSLTIIGSIRPFIDCASVISLTTTAMNRRVLTNRYDVNLLY